MSALNTIKMNKVQQQFLACFVERDIKIYTNRRYILLQGIVLLYH